MVSSYLNKIIRVYDSRPSRTLSTGLQEQLAHLYGHLDSSIEDNGLTIHRVPVQCQRGASDCGPFAIAFAVHAALGHDLQDVTFDQGKLRSHLLSCFSAGHLTEFPVMSSPVQRACEAQVYYVPLYCDCHMPESFDNLVACDHCDSWFHQKCVNYNENHCGDWFCKNCQ